MTTRLFWATLIVALPFASAGAQPTLKTSLGDCRPISPAFTGINAKMLLSDPWNTDWIDALKLTGAGNIRYPGGTAGNDWDWTIGRSERHKDYAYLPEQVKTAVDKAGVDVIWLVNLVTQNLDHCLAGLARGEAAGMAIDYVELGNEFYLRRYDKLFPTGKEYGEKAKAWITAIKQAHPRVKCAIATTMKYTSPRSAAWNKALFKACDNYDAVVAHWYVWPGIEPQNPKDQSKESMAAALVEQKATFAKSDGPAIFIGQPTMTWRDLRRNNDLPIDADVWATEFYVKDIVGATPGTWAHTLFTANQIHMLLEDGRVSRFCVQLLQKQAVPDGDAPDESYGAGSEGGEGRSFHLTASGMAMALYSRHVKEADRVAPILFDKTPQVRVKGVEAYPAVVGWKFGSSKASTAFLINFSSSPHEVTTRVIGGPEARVYRMSGDPYQESNSRLIERKGGRGLAPTLTLLPWSITEITGIASVLPIPERGPARPVPALKGKAGAYAGTETE